MTTKQTNKTLPNDPTMFPEPATWLSWTRDFPRQVVKRDANGDSIKIFNSEGRHIGFEYEAVPQDAEGKIRHHYSRAEARKSLLWLGRESKYRPEEERGRFYTDWAVYEYVDGEWVLRGQGFKGEKRRESAWFQQKVTKDEKIHPFDKVQQDKAIESILKAVG